MRTRYNWNIVESGVKHHNPPPPSIYYCLQSTYLRVFILSTFSTSCKMLLKCRSLIKTRIWITKWIFIMVKKTDIFCYLHSTSWRWYVDQNSAMLTSLYCQKQNTIWTFICTLTEQFVVYQNQNKHVVYCTVYIQKLKWKQIRTIQMEIRKRSKNEKRGLWGDNWNKQMWYPVLDVGVLVVIPGIRCWCSGCDTRY